MQEIDDIKCKRYRILHLSIDISGEMLYDILHKNKEIRFYYNAILRDMHRLRENVEEREETMAKKKNDETSFVFYRSFYDVMNLIPDEAVRSRAYTALCEYGFFGIEPAEDADVLVKMVFTQAKPQIDANNKRRESGSAGGTAKKEAQERRKNSKTESESVELPDGYQSVANSYHPDTSCVPNVNENANVNQNVNENEKENGNGNGNVHPDTGNPELDAVQRVKSAGGTRFTPPTTTQVQDYIAEKQLDVDAEQFIDYYKAKGWMVGNNQMCDWKAVLRNWNRQEKRHQEKQGGKRNEKGDNNNGKMEREFGIWV